MKKQLRMLGILLTVALSVLSFASIKLVPSASATYVEGPIIKDTVWTRVDSPFVISKDAMVYSNATLTIESGVEVRFGEDFSLIVSGKMYANGTDKTITFTSNKEQPVTGDWMALKFNGTQKSTLIGVSVSYAKNGMSVENGNVEVRDSTISSCSANGINTTSSLLIVQDSVLKDNTDNGISVSGNGLVTILNNTIIGNGNGVLLTGNQTSNVSVRQNTISANKEAGIRIDADVLSNIDIADNVVSSNTNGFYVESPTSTYISNNSISYNTVGIFYNLGNHTASHNDIYNNEGKGMDVGAEVTVNAEYNYWGDPSGPYHASLNPSGKGNPVGGDGVNLDFIFFLTEPNSYVNIRPVANLFTDKMLIPPNEVVEFYGTNSHDEGRVDMYLFDFGDGTNSGWTTLSIISHQYPSLGTYYAKLMVMDDFGAISDNATITINVQNLTPLQVNVDFGTVTVDEGQQVSVMIQVTDGATPLANANVTALSVKGGNFAPVYGLTNATGYFVTTFTAPDVTDTSNIRIIAKASLGGYGDGSNYKYLQVIPALSVYIVPNPNTIKSEETADVTVYVKSNLEFVANAAVTIASDVGNVSSTSGTADANGMFSLVFTAPETTSALTATITAIAQKEGYTSGSGLATVTVEPKILSLQFIVASSTTYSETQLGVTVHVEYSSTFINGANVTVMADNGNFTSTNGLTDAYGNVTFMFTAPPVNEQNVTHITAKAVKDRYADGESQLAMTVSPRTFDVELKLGSPTIESGQAVIVEVHVTSKEDASAVSGATVTISAGNGNFTYTTTTTDAAGVGSFIFTAPRTATQLSVDITANVTRNGYIAAGNQTTLTVTPETVAQAEGGFPWVTVLLILIPVIIAVVVVVLIKMKIIVISSKDEEE